MADTLREKKNTKRDIFARVIVDISAEAVDKYFEYRIPEELRDEIKTGTRIRIPFGQGNAQRTGYVVDKTDSPDFDREKLKDVSSVIKEAYSVEAGLFELAAFIAKEYGSTYSQALKTVLPVKRRVRKNRRREDPVKAIEELSTVERRGADMGEPASEKKKISLKALSPNREQEHIIGDLIRHYEKVRTEGKGISEGKRPYIKPSLIHGVTGSGKTLIYIKLIEYMQSLGKKTIVLIPEISLTYQTVSALSYYFGDRISVLHSKLSEGERYEQYEKALNGETDVMIGPRSAIFTAFKDLGLIIIDEEHDGAYHSDMTPRYDAREVARYRAFKEGAMLVMGSATPSLLSYKRALEGKYVLYRLMERAVRGAVLPNVHVADMRAELEKGNRTIFSDRLHELISDRLKRGEQTMLFLNRRGYAGFVSCRTCGRVIKCPHCDVSLTAHNNWYFDRRTGRREGALLSCHYCGYKTYMPRVCPECGSKYIAAFGVGTQKLESMTRESFPDARILRMDADTTSAKGAHERILSDFAKGKADILIGTQMIVKGHDFPKVTLVGIIAADMSLYASEYDCAERTFELLTQAEGRAGRGDIAGDVVVQTYDPSHYAIVNAVKQDYESFYSQEAEFRRMLGYPPFVNMLSISMSCEDEELLSETALGLESALNGAMKTSKLPEDTVIIGPVNAGIYKVNDIYRKILYIKHPNHDIIIRIRDSVRRFLRNRQGSDRIRLQYNWE